jgi:tRNA(Arg) A34 adenosine deaminase TadA
MICCRHREDEIRVAWQKEKRAVKKHCVVSVACLALLCLFAWVLPEADWARTLISPTTQDEDFMAQALEQAHLAAQHGNYPFGAVLVKDGWVVARAENTAISDKTISHHAEINLIDKACRELGVQSLEGYTMYSSAEPCAMCSGAIVHFNVSTVVYGASQEYLRSLKPGYLGIGITDMKPLLERKKVEVRGPVLREAAEKILADYLKAEGARANRH